MHTTKAINKLLKGEKLIWRPPEDFLTKVSPKSNEEEGDFTKTLWKALTREQGRLGSGPFYFQTIENGGTKMLWVKDAGGRRRRISAVLLMTAEGEKRFH